MAIPALPAPRADWSAWGQGLDAEIRTGRLSDTGLRTGFATVADDTAQQALGLTLRKAGIAVGLGTPASNWRGMRVESPHVWFDQALLKWCMVCTGYGDILSNGTEYGSIGLLTADQPDGPWTEKGVVLSRTGTGGDPDAGSVTGPVVWYESGTYYLFYIGCTQGGYEAGVKTICLATTTATPDTWTNASWTRRGSIISAAGSGFRSAAIFQPWPVKRGSTYYLFFNALGSTGKETIGYATATSPLGPWTVDDTNSPVLNVTAAAWDKDILSLGQVYRHGDLWVMYYMGASTSGTVQASDGVAVTTDAAFPLGWTKYAGNPILSPGPTGSIDELYAHKPAIVRHGGRHLHYYTAVKAGDTNRRIALAYGDHPGLRFGVATSAAPGTTNYTVTSTTPVLLDSTWTVPLYGARAGDWIEFTVSFTLANQTADMIIDVATMVGGAPVNYMASGGTWAKGLQGLYTGGGRFEGVSDTAVYQLKAGDLDHGLLVMGLHVATTANRVILSDSTNRVRLTAVNQGRTPIAA